MAWLWNLCKPTKTFHMRYIITLQVSIPVFYHPTSWKPTIYFPTRHSKDVLYLLIEDTPWMVDPLSCNHFQSRSIGLFFWQFSPILQSTEGQYFCILRCSYRYPSWEHLPALEFLKFESINELFADSRVHAPNFLSISCSTGRPWQSQPKRLTTCLPVVDANRVTISYIWMKQLLHTSHITQTLIVPAKRWP